MQNVELGLGERGRAADDIPPPHSLIIFWCIWHRGFIFVLFIDIILRLHIGHGGGGQNTSMSRSPQYKSATTALVPYSHLNIRFVDGWIRYLYISKLNFYIYIHTSQLLDKVYIDIFKVGRFWERSSSMIYFVCMYIVCLYVCLYVCRSHFFWNPYIQQQLIHFTDILIKYKIF